MESMIAGSSIRALTIMIFSLLVSYGSCARSPPVNFNASALTADPNWEAARATWYGAPTGAVPDDNGTYIHMYIDHQLKQRLGVFQVWLYHLNVTVLRINK